MRYNIYLLLSLVLATSGCAPAVPVETTSDIRATASLRHNKDIFPKTASLAVHNESKQALCFLRSNIDATTQNISASENGKLVEANIIVEHEISEYNNIDFASGIEVVPPGDRAFVVDLSPFDTSRDLTIQLSLELMVCDTMWGGHPVTKKFALSVRTAN